MEDLGFHLYGSICLERGVTLRDIFILMARSPYIFSIGTCCPFLDDLVEEALATPKINEENSDIAALRLKWISIIDHDSDGRFFHDHLDFHGVGQEKKQHSVQTIY